MEMYSFVCNSFDWIQSRLSC